MEGMLLLSYSEDQIKEILTTILHNNKFDIVPVGNHHLKRHLVYRINIENEKSIIFKLYYKTRRRSREIASLKSLESSNVKCPKILEYGNLENGQEWLIMDYIEGVLFDNIITDIPMNIKLNLFEQLGEELGKIHSFKTFNFFGEWDEGGNSIKNITNYFDFFVTNVEQDIELVLSQDIPDKEALIKAIDQIRNNYSLLKINPTSRLLHNDFDGRNVLVNKVGEEYFINGVIDFEGSYPGNPETNFIGLYFRYFLENGDYEKAFFRGYEKHLQLNEGFNERMFTYLLCFIVGNCSWAYWQAPEYYKQNIEFLYKILG